MIDRVVEALSGKHYRYIDEAMLHAGLSQALAAAGIEHQHEVKVVGGRIDFVVDTLGVEVKIKGSTEALRAQVERYAENDHLTEFLVVTTRPAHRLVEGATSNGKPVRVLTIGGLSL